MQISRVFAIIILLYVFLLICACSSGDRASASDAVCAGSIPVRRTSTEPVLPTTGALAGSLTRIGNDSCTSLTALLLFLSQSYSGEHPRANHVVARELAPIFQMTYCDIAYGTVICLVQITQHRACAPDHGGARKLAYRYRK